MWLLNRQKKNSESQIPAVSSHTVCSCRSCRKSTAVSILSEQSVNGSLFRACTQSTYKSRYAAWTQAVIFHFQQWDCRGDLTPAEVTEDSKAGGWLLTDIMVCSKKKEGSQAVNMFSVCKHFRDIHKPVNVNIQPTWDLRAVTSLHCSAVCCCRLCGSWLFCNLF